MMEEQTFEMSPKAQQELLIQCEIFAKATRELYEQLAEQLAEIVKIIMEKVREISIQLGRFFLKKQMLEWRLPARIADFISQKIYGPWAVKIGFRWLHNKIVMLE